jgi:hypothetical protein
MMRPFNLKQQIKNIAMHRVTFGNLPKHRQHFRRSVVSRDNINGHLLGFGDRAPDQAATLNVANSKANTCAAISLNAGSIASVKAKRPIFNHASSPGW